MEIRTIKLNPADHASRGLGIADSQRKISTWSHDSNFL